MNFWNLVLKGYIGMVEAQSFDDARARSGNPMARFDSAAPTKPEAIKLGERAAAYYGCPFRDLGSKGVGR